jgi:tetratricopeptide (TPR) repeat protein
LRRNFRPAAMFLFALACSLPLLGAGNPAQIGEVNFPTHCAASVQGTMETGLALLHSFQYEKAEHAFTSAEHDDPQCALAYWGKAMALYEPLWDFPNAKALALGWQYVQQAQKLDTQDARIRGYIDAAAAFYHPGSLKPMERVRAHSSSMERLYLNHQEDNEAGEIYALSLIALAQMGVDDLANRKKAIAILKPIFAKYPENPGAAHYLIHATDARELAAEGLAAARAYAKIAPDSAHALHMPSHIFRRLGMWREMIDSNLASAGEASKEGRSGVDYQLHAMDFLDYAFLQSGQEAKARELVTESKNVGQATESERIDAQNRLGARNALELHQWKEAAALEIPHERLEWQDYTYWARAIGAARSGDVRGARAAVQELVEIGQLIKSEEMRQEPGGSMAMTGMSIDPSEAAGWLEYAESQPEKAVAILRGAAEQEEEQDAEPFAAPAREMLADLMLELKRPTEALTEYRKALKSFPNRFNSLYGAARAANAAGDTHAATDFYAKLIANCPANADRPELREARNYVAAHPN